jgi:ribonuclease VapC
VLFEEPDAESLVERLLSGSSRRLSAASLLEAGIKADGHPNPNKGPALDSMIAEMALKVEPVTAEQAQIAREAYRRFGRGNHPARLNFGDCFAYALAKATGEPLLFKGNDFSKTDVAPL